MDTIVPAFYDVGRCQLGEILQPKAGRLGFPVSEHPRLDDLIRFANLAANDADWVLDSYPLDRCIHEQTNEV